MNRPLKVLIAEDNPADAELLLAALEGAGFAPDLQRVETGDDFRAALHPGLELVLSDFQMPRFNGLEALRILQASGLTIPFIIVSGTIGEETAVEAMRSGASDYLLKDRLARLGPAITMALEQTRLRQERRASIERVRASEASYRALFEHAPDGIVIADQESRYLDANPSMCRMLGYSREELVGLHAADIVAPAEIPHIEPALTTIKAQQDYHREWQFRRKDGSTFPAEVTATTMPDGNLLGVIRDIAERREADKRIQDQLKELLRWQDVMLTREDRVQILKAEVNALLAEQGRSPRYVDTNPQQ